MTPKLTSFCVLNCVDDVKFFLAEFGDDYQRWNLVSTHGAVNDYLRTLSIDCLELSSLITNEFLSEVFQEADTSVNYLLCQLDNQFAGDISSLLGVQEMEYFSALYRYWGKYEYLSILKLKKALELLFDSSSPCEVMIYQSVPTSFFTGSDLVTSVVQLLSKRYQFSLITKKNEIRSQPVAVDNLFQKAAKAIQEPVRAYRKIKELLLKKSRFRPSAHKKNLILLEPLYDLEFLKNILPTTYNVLIWPAEGFPANISIKADVDPELFLRIKSIIATLSVHTIVGEDNSSSFALKLLAENLTKDFVERAQEYLTLLVILTRLHAKQPIDLVAWGNSPAHGAKSLLGEYLLKAGVPVLGMQHGGSYGIQNCLSTHFDSDFSRCTHYLTYGFDGNDLKHTYPGREAACEIIPVGSNKEHRQKNYRLEKKKKFDILFPLTNSMSLSMDGFRLKPDLLTSYQLKILQILDEFIELRIVTKPPPNYSDRNCSVMEILKNLRHVEVIKDITLEQWLAQYEARAVVIEFPSTPLFEVIGKDMDIFLMADPILPFSQESLTLLKKRVHYFEDIEDLRQALIAWKNGDLPTLRNDMFYRRHVFREKTPDLILNVIEKCI